MTKCACCGQYVTDLDVLVQVIHFRLSSVTHHFCSEVCLSEYWYKKYKQTGLVGYQRIKHREM